MQFLSCMLTSRSISQCSKICKKVQILKSQYLSQRLKLAFFLSQRGLWHEAKVSKDVDFSLLNCAIQFVHIFVALFFHYLSTECSSLLLWKACKSLALVGNSSTCSILPEVYLCFLGSVFISARVRSNSKILNSELLELLFVYITYIHSFSKSNGTSYKLK